MTLIAVPRYASQWIILSCGHVNTCGHDPLCRHQIGDRVLCGRCWQPGAGLNDKELDNGVRLIAAIYRRTP